MRQLSAVRSRTHQSDSSCTTSVGQDGFRVAVDAWSFAAQAAITAQRSARWTITSHEGRRWRQTGEMEEGEYDRALGHLIGSLELEGSPDIVQAVVAAGSDSTSPGRQLVASLRALRSIIASSDRTRVLRVLDTLNSVASTETGEPISEVYLELTEAEARLADVERIDLTQGADDFEEVLAQLDELISDLLDDGALSNGTD